jgi:signal transduction histidine kinase
VSDRIEFSGGGEVGALIRAFDWSKTPLGPSGSWPVALQALVRVMMNTCQPMIVWWGPELIQIYNDAMVPSLGRGKHPSGLGQGARACWPETWPVVGAQVESVLAGGTAIWSEEVLVPVFRNGALEDAWWTYSYSPAYDDHGAIAGILIICTETTSTVVARRALERSKRKADVAREEIRGVFMQAPLPIAILTGPEHRITLTNASYDLLVGRETLGKPIAEAFNEEEIGYYLPILDEVFRTGKPVVIREAKLQLLNAEGVLEERYMDLFYHPYRNAELATLGVLSVINDVTASVSARQEAETAGRVRDEFLAMLGHELRNPLAPISTATQLMRMRGDHFEKERQIIDRQVEHLSRLVDDLLDVARVARGKIDLQREKIEVSDVVSKAVETASPLLEQRAHTVRIDVPRRGLVVDGDPVRLAQVIGNLLNNAAKYTPAGGHIEVAAASAGGHVTITVADDGPGLAESLLPRVFDLFVQGKRPMDRAEGGLGLGLALVKNLVALHGGSVSAKNRATGGSEFSVTIPRENTSTTDDVREVVTAERLIAETKVPRRVLVVDDNLDAAEMVSELLQVVGHDVVVAHDGPEALRALRSFHADVGLLDLGLPGMDGFELARRIREQCAVDTPRLIAVTGYGQEHDRAGTRTAGFEQHLTKPVAIEDLIKVVEG